MCFKNIKHVYENMFMIMCVLKKVDMGRRKVMEMGRKNAKKINEETQNPKENIKENDKGKMGVGSKPVRPSGETTAHDKKKEQTGRPS